MRKNRIYSETGFYHIVIRGVNKQNIFYDTSDRRLFITLIKKYGKKYHIKIYAFCLMENHVHLEVKDEMQNISIFMQSVCSIYARLFNRKYDRIGHLFQERFASEVIKDNIYFLNVFRYIMQNPLQAGLCNSLDYDWSSFKLYKYINSFVEKKWIKGIFSSEIQMNEFLNKETNTKCLEIELRPSEKQNEIIKLVTKILGSNNPIIKLDSSRAEIEKKLKALKLAGISIRTISRITGVPKFMVQRA